VELRPWCAGSEGLEGPLQRPGANDLNRRGFGPADALVGMPPAAPPHGCGVFSPLPASIGGCAIRDELCAPAQAPMPAPSTFVLLTGARLLTGSNPAGRPAPAPKMRLNILSTGDGQLGKAYGNRMRWMWRSPNTKLEDRAAAHPLGLAGVDRISRALRLLAAAGGSVRRPADAPWADRPMDARKAL